MNIIVTNTELGNLNLITDRIKESILFKEKLKNLHIFVNDFYFNKPYFYREVEELVDDFILSYQYIGIENSVTGELNNYIKGFYSENDESTQKAISNFNSLYEILDLVISDLVYSKLMFIADSYSKNHVVVDRGIEFNVYVSYKDVVDFYEKFLNDENMTKLSFNSYGERIVFPFHRCCFEHGYVVGFDFSLRHLLQSEVDISDIIGEIDNIFDMVNVENFEERSLSYSDIYLEIMGSKLDCREFCFSDVSMSNKKIKKIDKKFNRLSTCYDMVKI